MRKDKAIIGLLLVTFLGTVGMFGYQNFYLKNQAEANMVNVYVAKKDIGEGVAFSSDNIGIIKMSKESVMPTFVKDFKELQGKKANSVILANDLVTKGRIDNEKPTKDTFTILLEPSYKVNLKKDDVVNVYIQMTEMDENDPNLTHYKTYRLLEREPVKEVNFKKTSGGKVTEEVGSIALTLDEQQTVDYYISSYMKDKKPETRIIVVKYEDLLQKEDTEIPSLSEHANYNMYKDSAMKRIENGSTTTRTGNAKKNESTQPNAETEKSVTPATQSTPASETK